MKYAALIFPAVLLAACSGASIGPGDVKGGCTGMTSAEWAALPGSAQQGAIMNGLSVKTKIKGVSRMAAPMLGVGSIKITPRVPSAVNISQDGASAYVMVSSPVVLSWNGKNLKCKAA